MAFREVRVFEVREVLRLWLSGEELRSVARLSQVDRKTVRRYVGAAEQLGLDRDGNFDQLSDVFVGLVVEAVRPHRHDGHGEAWRLLAANHDEIKAWVDAGLTGVKIHELLERRGVVVPLRTVQRYVLEVCGRSRGRGPTVRIADGEPGDELQVDFGRMGVLSDGGKRRVVWALIFTACFSRHCFVWLSYRQTAADVIDGFEAAWRFFGGVFQTVIPDNLKAIVDEADPLEPRLSQDRCYCTGSTVRARPSSRSLRSWTHTSARAPTCRITVGSAAGVSCPSPAVRPALAAPNPSRHRIVVVFPSRWGQGTRRRHLQARTDRAHVQQPWPPHASVDTPCASPRSRSLLPCPDRRTAPKRG